MVRRTRSRRGIRPRGVPLRIRARTLLLAMLACLSLAQFPRKREKFSHTPLKGHARPITALAMFPDGTRLASASEDKTVRVLDLADRSEERVLKGHEEPGRVYALAVSSNGRTWTFSNAAGLVAIGNLDAILP